MRKSSFSCHRGPPKAHEVCAENSLSPATGSRPPTSGITELLVDSHCHLDDSDFDADREAVIERARGAGVRYLLAVGGASGPEDLGRAMPLAERYAWIYVAAGIHPHEAIKAEGRHFEQLKVLARTPKFLALGEIGLDYYYDHSPRQVQKQVLIRQLELAQELKLPVIIHCRDAWSDLREIFRKYWRSSPQAGILHCFTGTREDADAFLDQGFLVSFAGNVTFKAAENLRAVAREIPLDRLLSETDSPYLAPMPHRGKRNEPAYVREVTRALASLRNLTEAEMGRQIAHNFVRLFRLS